MGVYTLEVKSLERPFWIWKHTYPTDFGRRQFFTPGHPGGLHFRGVSHVERPILGLMITQHRVALLPNISKWIILYAILPTI